MPKSWSIEIDDSDLDNAVNNSIPKAIDQGIRDALQEGADNILSSVTSACPVRTGFLRSTISSDVSDTEFSVQATADYASYVEAKRHFFYPNANRVTAGIHTTIESKIQANLPD